jgi:hypothetical protein
MLQLFFKNILALCVLYQKKVYFYTVTKQNTSYEKETAFLHDDS